MSDQTEVPELFLRMGDGGATPKADRWHEQGGTLPYQAVQLAPAGQTSPTLRIHYSTGDVEILRYGQFTSILYLGHSGTLTLSIPTGAIQLAGVRLDKLLDGLEQQKIERLQAYVPERHALPASHTQTGEPVIEELSWAPTETMEFAQNRGEAGKAKP